MKIAGHALFQIARLAHIKHLALFVKVAIHPRQRRQRGHLGQQLRRMRRVRLFSAAASGGQIRLCHFGKCTKAPENARAAPIKPENESGNQAMRRKVFLFSPGPLKMPFRQKMWQNRNGFSLHAGKIR